MEAVVNGIRSAGEMDNGGGPDDFQRGDFRESVAWNRLSGDGRETIPLGLPPAQGVEISRPDLDLEIVGAVLIVGWATDRGWGAVKYEVFEAGAIIEDFVVNGGDVSPQDGGGEAGAKKESATANGGDAVRE